MNYYMGNSKQKTGIPKMSDDQALPDDKAELAALYEPNLSIPRQIADPSTSGMSKYKYNSETESSTHFRMSNFAIKALMTLSPQSWRMFSTISEQLDLYPMELISDEDFLMRFSQGKAVIPVQHRTIKLKASDYERRWQLPAGSAYRTFTLDALALYDDSLTSTQFLGESLDEVYLTRPVSSIRFGVQQSGSNQTKQFGPDSLIGLTKHKDREKQVKSGFWQAREIEFELNEHLVHRMLLVQRYFTRIEKKPTVRLSKPAYKLYTMLNMIAGTSRQINGKWRFNLTLEEINLALKLTAASIPFALVTVLKYCEEISKKTQFNVTPVKDMTTKDGNRFTEISISFSEKSEMPVIEPPKKITRKLVTRPRVATGSQEELDWAKKNLLILLDFEVRLSRVSRKLPKADEERIARYREMLGDQAKGL